MPYSFWNHTDGETLLLYSCISAATTLITSVALLHNLGWSLPYSYPFYIEITAVHSKSEPCDNKGAFQLQARRTSARWATTIASDGILCNSTIWVCFKVPFSRASHISSRPMNSRLLFLDWCRVLRWRRERPRQYMVQFSWNILCLGPIVPSTSITLDRMPFRPNVAFQTMDQFQPIDRTGTNKEAVFVDPDIR